jgi:biopolymer transport protein ExbD
MKICPYCGAELEDDYKFCPTCKKMLEDSTEDKAITEDLSNQDIFTLPESISSGDKGPDQKAVIYAIIGMSCGIASLVLFWFGFLMMGFFPIALGIAGIVFSALSKKKGKDKKATVGLVTSIIGLILSIIASVVILVMAGSGAIKINKPDETTTTTIAESSAEVTTKVETTTEATTEVTTEATTQEITTKKVTPKTTATTIETTATTQESDDGGDDDTTPTTTQSEDDAEDD